MIKRTIEIFHRIFPTGVSQHPFLAFCCFGGAQGIISLSWKGKKATHGQEWGKLQSLWLQRRRSLGMVTIGPAAIDDEQRLYFTDVYDVKRDSRERRLSSTQSSSTRMDRIALHVYVC